MSSLWSTCSCSIRQWTIRLFFFLVLFFHIRMLYVAHVVYNNNDDDIIQQQQQTTTETDHVVAILQNDTNRFYPKMMLNSFNQTTRNNNQEITTTTTTTTTTTAGTTTTTVKKQLDKDNVVVDKEYNDNAHTSSKEDTTTQSNDAQEQEQQEQQQDDITENNKENDHDDKEDTTTVNSAAQETISIMTNNNTTANTNNNHKDKHNMIADEGTTTDRTMTTTTTTTTTLLPGLPTDRSSRFPSIEERIRVYMGPWYLPPCDNNMNSIHVLYRYDNTNQTVKLTVKGGGGKQQQQQSKSMVLDSEARKTNKLFFAKQSDFGDCHSRIKQLNQTKRVLHECIAVRKTIPKRYLWNQDAGATFSQEVQQEQQQQEQQQQQKPPPPPIILRIYDRPREWSVPSFHFCRPAWDTTKLDEWTNNNNNNNNTNKGGSCNKRRTIAPLPPIVWNLNFKRLFRHINEVARSDCFWENKRNGAIFRGAMTGTVKPIRDWNINDMTKCQHIERCRFVMQYANSTKVNAKLSAEKTEHYIYFTNPNNISGIPMVMEENIPLADQLKYKALIFLDGAGTSKKSNHYYSRVLFLKKYIRHSFVFCAPLITLFFFFFL